jgi:hypothetical protein
MRREPRNPSRSSQAGFIPGWCLIAVVACTILITPAAGAAETSNYGYFRTLEGTAGVLPAGATEAAEISVNQPILTGDRILVDPASRLEVVLPDGSRLRLDSGADLTLTALANSGDQASDSTLLTLTDGLIQLVVPAGGLADGSTRIDTGNTTAYVREPGTYRLDARGVRYTEITVRDGSLEVLTRRGSTILRRGDALRVKGDDWPDEALADAGPELALERWGDRLETEIAQAALPSSVDENLAYAAQPLDEYGDWMQVEGRTAWRPRVSAGWSPYTDGRWAYSPSGLTWVSYEPWGWMPYHYGAWDFVPYYGWVWYPGSVYAPAWVYWYWGPSYVGWCPIGFYADFYGPRYARLGFGLRWGAYGWVGGDWGLYTHWNFVPTRRFASRDLRHHVHNAAWITREHGHGRLERGLLTTDTAVLTRSDLRNPENALRAISTRTVSAQPGGYDLANLPDATPFVARREQLDGALERRVLTRDTEHRIIAPPARAASTRRASRRATSVSTYRGTEVGVPANERFSAVDVTGGGSRAVSGAPTRSSKNWRDGGQPIRRGTGGGTVSIVRPALPDRQPRPARPPIGRTDEAVAPEVRLPANRTELARPVLDRPALDRPLLRHTPGTQAPAATPRATLNTRRGSTANPNRNGGASVRSLPIPSTSGARSDRVPVVRRVIDGLRSVAPMGGRSRVTGRTLSPSRGSSASSARRATPRASAPRPTPRSSAGSHSSASGGHARSGAQASSSSSHGRGRASRSRGNH